MEVPLTRHSENMRRASVMAWVLPQYTAANRICDRSNLSGSDLASLYFYLSRESRLTLSYIKEDTHKHITCFKEDYFTYIQ